MHASKSMFASFICKFVFMNTSFASKSSYLSLKLSNFIIASVSFLSKSKLLILAFFKLVISSKKFEPAYVSITSIHFATKSNFFLRIESIFVSTSLILII